MCVCVRFRRYSQVPVREVKKTADAALCAELFKVVGAQETYGYKMTDGISHTKMHKCSLDPGRHEERAARSLQR